MKIKTDKITEINDNTYSAVASMEPGKCKLYTRDGVLHREDGPAVEFTSAEGTYDNGRKEWFKDGIRHREDGPAIGSPETDDVLYYCMGRLHRTDGPAMVLQGVQHWYIDGVEQQH